MDRAQLTTLATEIAKSKYRGMDYVQIAAALNAPTADVPNPTPQPTRRKLITYVQFLNALTVADMGKYYTSGIASDLRRALDGSDYDMALALWRGLKALLTATSVTAVETVFAAVNETELDPTWPATVPGPSIAAALGLPTVATRDVQAALHMGA